MRPQRSAASLFLLGWLLLGFSVLGTGTSLDLTNPEPVPWLAELRRTQARPTGADAILRHLTPGPDGWISEKFDEEIEARLKELSAALAARPLDPASLADFVHPQFRGTPLAPQRRVLLREEPPVVEQLEPATEHTVTAATFPEELARFAAPDHPLERAKLKVIGISLDPEDSRQVRTRIWYDVVNRGTHGEVEQRNGHWRLLWRREADRPWQLLRLTAEPAHRVRSRQVHFTDVTPSALPSGPAFQQLQRGLDYWTKTLDAASLIDIFGHNGVAVADVNRDGWEDFYVAQPSGLPNRLFLNQGDGTFRERAAAAGVDVLDRITSPLFLDYDNDGDPDLLLLGLLGPLLFENDGTGSFEPLDPEQIGLIQPGQTFHDLVGACAADYDRDGWLDFYVTSYVFQGDTEGILRPTPYHDAQNGPPNLLYRNNGDGTFSEVTAQTGLDHNNNRFSFACAWGDYNDDGWPDLYVANDFGRNNLYRADGHGTFTDVAAEAGVEDIGAGMSAAWMDYDNDGRLDLYVGNMWSSAGLRVTTQPQFMPGASADLRSLYQRHAKGNSLFRNRGDGTFEDVSLPAGVALGRWAWASHFLDFDRDGYEDLYIVNGFITNESAHDL